MKNMKIKVLQYNWGKYNNYLGLMPFNLVSHLIDNDVDYSMNRDVDKVRVGEIIKHIEKKADNLFFPPVILNSNSGIGISLDTKNMEISLESPIKLKIIDGQHRLTAIKEILTKDGYDVLRSKVKDHEIPFVLIESLESEEHRIIFNEINQNAEKVGNVVSERFEPNTQNLISLRYLSENPEYKKLVEWEKEQSDSKIVYIHLVRCIELLKKAFLRLLNKEQREALFTEPYHRNENYYSIQKCFLDMLFSHIMKIKTEELKKEFWVKRVVLIALTEKLISSLFKSDELKKIGNNEEIINIVKEKFNTILQEYLPTSLYFKYSGSTSQTKATYEAIQTYISINKKLEILKLEEPSSENLKVLLNRYLEVYKQEQEQESNFVEDEEIKDLGYLIKGFDLIKEEEELLNPSELSLSQIQTLVAKIKEEEE